MIIFVAGAHGVGKTYLAGPVAEQLGIRHATASQLIRDERGMQSWNETKEVSDIDNNQIALISALRKLKESKQSLLLDGHFVLRENNGAHVPIEEKIFRDLHIDAVLLLEVDAEVIHARLKDRNDFSWNIASLKSFSQAEAIHAARVTSSLNLPLTVIQNPTPVQFKKIVECLLKQH